MPTPTIPDGELFFNATTYTGTGATQAVANGAPGQSFQPDLVWIRNRPNASGGMFIDSVRGSSVFLQTTNGNGDGSNSGDFVSFNSNGFSVGNNGNLANESGATFVGWNWKAGGAAVTNTAGSITSQVSSNPTSGFSIATYTGTGANATVGHGCLVNGVAAAPNVVIVKRRTGGSDSWATFTTMTSDGYLFLNSASAKGTGGAATLFGNGSTTVSPTNTVFSIATDSSLNAGSSTYVAYCWAEVSGYSKFGSFTGNGLVDGPFVYLGFRPAFFMVKRTDSPGSDWFMLDDQRPTFNVIGAGNGGQFPANLTYAESTLSSYPIADFLSNGIKVRGDMNVGYWTASGGTYIYMAFAENPFKYANAR